MGTELLSVVTVDQAVVAVVNINGGAHLAETLGSKGFARVVLAAHPRDTAKISRDASVHLVLVNLAKADDEELRLLHTLREGPEPPRVIAIVEFDSVRQKLEPKLGDAAPDRMLVKPVTNAKLLHEVEEQLRKRSVAGRPEEDAPLFAEVLAEVWHTKRSGVLRVMSSGMQTVVYFRGGRPLFAEGGTAADMLGRILVETKRITDQQLSQAVDLMTNRLVEHEQLQLGGALVELGFINPSELFEMLKVQVRRKLLTCFSWQKVRAEFREGEEHTEGVTEFANAVPALLVEGLAQIPDEEVRRFLDRVDHLYAVCSASGREIEQAYGLGGRDRRLLDAVDGLRTVRQLREGGTAGERTGQLLMALVLGRALVLSSGPAVPAAPPAGEAPAPPSSHRGPIYGTARRTPGDELNEEQEEEGWNRVRALFRRKRD